MCDYPRQTQNHLLKKIKKSLDKEKLKCYNKDVKKTNKNFKKERGSYYEDD